jgi:hypothetical protein
MDGDLSAVVQAAKKLALLAETLERRSGEAVATQQRAAMTLAQAVIDVRSDASRILEASRAEVSKATHESLNAHLTDRAGRFDNDISSATNRILEASRTVDDSVDRTRASLRHLFRLGMGWTALTCALLAGAGAILIGYGFRSYTEAKARADAARVNAEVVEAYARVGMTSCGGTPCVRLDAKAPRWGTNGQYVLVRTKPHE